MTAIDRRQIIEDAARAMHNTAGQWRWERLSAEEPLWAEGWRDNAKAALPVIVAAVLKPIRELHREQFQFCREPRPEFQALIDAFQPEYDALLKEDR